MIEGKWFAPGAEIPEAAAIRGAVFGRGQDALDQESWNVVVYLTALRWRRAASGGGTARSSWGMWL